MVKYLMTFIIFLLLSVLQTETALAIFSSADINSSQQIIYLDEQIYADEDEEAKDECNLQKIKEEFVKDGEVMESCWFCKVVNGITQSFLSAAAQALDISKTLGEVIAKTGFMIWLAYYILQQVSSVAPITPGKMLQEILIMGFKVALAIAAIRYITDVCKDFIIDPIVSLGIDYGIAILNGLT